MAYKVLGQLAAAATTEEGLYAVPASSSAVVSTIVIANRGATTATYRLAVKPTAATTLATNHYIAYDVPIAANDSVALTIGLTLAATNAIRTYASNTNLTFSAFGSES
jgi:methenyltetrahydromethanopterin cyclohydrolase